MASVFVRLIGQDQTGPAFASANAKTKTLGRNVGAVAGKLKMASVAVIGLGAVSVNSFAKFDNSVREITTLLGDVTENGIRRLGDEIRATAIRYGQALDSMAKARYDIISAGFNDAARSAVLMAESAKLAVAGVAQVSQTADLLTTVLNAYNMSAKEAAHVSDVMFTTVRLGKTTISDLASNFGTISSIAPTVGVGLEELAAILATLTTALGSTEISTTALQAAMVSFLKPSEPLKARLKEIGYDSGVAAIKALGFAEALKRVAEGADETRLGEYFGNVRAARAIFPLVSTLSEKLKNNIEEMGKAAGATDQAVGKMSRGMQYEINVLKARFSSAAVTIGGHVSKWINAFFKLSPLIKNLSFAVVAFGVSFATLGPWVTAAIALAGAFYYAWDQNLFGTRVALEKFKIYFYSTIVYMMRVMKLMYDTSSLFFKNIGTGLLDSLKILKAALSRNKGEIGKEIIGLFSDVKTSYTNMADIFTKFAENTKAGGKIIEEELQKIDEKYKGFKPEKFDIATMLGFDIKMPNVEEIKEQVAKIKETIQDLMTEQIVRATVKTEFIGEGGEGLIAPPVLETEMISEEYVARESERYRRLLMINEDFYKNKLSAAQDAYEAMWELTNLETEMMVNSNRLIGESFKRDVAIGMYNAMTRIALEPLAGAINKWRNKQKTVFGKFLVDIVSMFASAVTQMIAKWAIFQLFVRGFGMSPLSIGRFLGMQQGGIVGEQRQMMRAQSGITVPKQVGMDRVPILAQPGEAIIPVESVRNNMPMIHQLITNQNVQQGGAQNTTFQINMNVDAIDSQDVERFVKEGRFGEVLVEAINDKLIELQVGNKPVKALK